MAVPAIRSGAISSLVLLCLVFGIHIQAEVYRVRPNDNLTLIANRYGITPEAIAKANKISVKDVIVPGQVLSIPVDGNPTQTRFVKYKVQKGDRLADIAQKFDVSITTISRDNRLKNANQIYVGQVLNIRQSEASPSAQLRNHRVQRGDTIASIADHYDVSVREILNANSIRNANLIKPGQLIRIPSNASGNVLNPENELAYDLRQRLESVNVSPGKWKRIMIHHTATDVGSFKSIDDYHRTQRHMQNGMAYHFLIGNGKGMGDGLIVVGPRWQKQIDGGHTKIEWLNATSIGICLVGNFHDNGPPTRKQMDQLALLCRYLMSHCGIPKSNLITHSIAYQKFKGLSTVCPGKNFDLEELKDKI